MEHMLLPNFPWKPRYEYVLVNGTVYVRDTHAGAGAVVTEHADRVPVQLLRAKLERYERDIRRHELTNRLRLFLERGAGTVSPLDIAWVASELAAVDLDIPPVEVELASAEESRRLGWNGWITNGSNIIFVAENLCLCRAAITATHEVRHRYQFIIGTNLSLESDQHDAKTYERTFIRKYLLGIRCSKCGRSVEAQAA